MLKIELIEFIDTKENYILMHKWCSNKFVYEWFEQRILSYDEIVNKYKTKLKDNKQKLYFIKYGNKPIGFIQIYKYNDTIYDYLKKYTNIYEYDIFIGEENYLSKGLGTKIITSVNNLIYNKYLADCILLRPFKRNIRAIKCYQKNNFKLVAQYDGIDSIGNKEEIVVLIQDKIL